MDFANMLATRRLQANLMSRLLMGTGLIKEEQNQQYSLQGIDNVAFKGRINRCQLEKSCNQLEKYF